jgi:DNA-binding MarR family transcriptional regulator
MTTGMNSVGYRAQDNLGFCLSRAALIMQAAVDSALKEVGLSRLSWTVLAGIRFDGVTSPSKLAKFIGLERTTVSRIISRLEKEGFVTRQPNEVDGRGHKVELTALGYDVCDRAPAMIQNAMRPYLLDVSENEVGQLIALLKRIGDGTDADWTTSFPS